jgi:hypothetical protein
MVSSCLTGTFTFIGPVILTLRVVALYSRHLIITRILYVLLVLNWLLTLVPAVYTLYLWNRGSLLLLTRKRRG